MPSQQRVQWAKVRIMVVVVSALAVLVVLIVLLSGGTWLKPKAYLTTHIPDATGVEPGADVQLNGVLIGKVEAVQLTPSKTPSRVVEVRLKVEEEFRKYIPEDSVTGIDSANMLGDKYIDITMGRSGHIVPNGGELQYRLPSSMMQNIDMEQFDAQLKTIDQIIQDIQEGKGPLGQFVASDTLYDQFLKGVSDIEKKMRAATGSQSELGQALYTTTMHDNLHTSIKELDDKLAQLQSSALMRDPAQYDQIRDQVDQIRQTLADLNAGKGAGGQMLVSDAAYTDWNHRLAGWIQNLDAMNAGEGAIGQMVANAQTYESLNGTMQELRSTMKDLREHPQKYLRLKIF